MPSPLSGFFGIIVADIIKGLSILGGLLGVLKANGISTGSIGSMVAQDITNVEAYQTDYDSGQAVIVGKFQYSDAQGTSEAIVAVMKQGGPAYASLFGSST